MGKNIITLETGENKKIDVIVGTILARAQKLADSIISDAKAAAEENAAQKRVNIDAYCAKIMNDARAEAQKIIDHSEMLSEMESTKIVQNSLAHILDRIFSDAERNTLNNENYLELLEGMIKKYAEANDEVIVSAKEERLTADWLQPINLKYKLNLKLSDEKGDFSGGMILRNKIYDKNLTVTTLIKTMREEMQTEIISLVTAKQEQN